LKDEEARVKFLYRRAYSRDPDDDELKASLQFVRTGAGDAAGDRWEQLAHVLLAANEFVFVD